LKLTHFSKFQNETLFYIFYAMPKDALQVLHITYTYTYMDKSPFISFQSPS
jgi:hypothetical protein